MAVMTDWVALPGGRARFAEGIRGWDDRGHETFAVDLDGRVLYGEIRRRFSGNLMYVEIVSFGYPVQLDVGISEAAQTLTRQEISRVEELVRGLIVSADALDRSEKPLSLLTFGGAIFSGDVVFDENWITPRDG